VARSRWIPNIEGLESQSSFRFDLRNRRRCARPCRELYLHSSSSRCGYALEAFCICCICSSIFLFISFVAAQPCECLSSTRNRLGRQRSGNGRPRTCPRLQSKYWSAAAHIQLAGHALCRWHSISNFRRGNNTDIRFVC
jgi:hypothetical protein